MLTFEKDQFQGTHGILEKLTVRENLGTCWVCEAKGLALV